ncbi:hypothetical protein RRF57_012506 [Xylaria bambusicola]|uniref:GST C-terminal domain-containing protein n=1 Tax=Xylaria bambusicola TaxID=326684 RepID=A0AAN7UWK9_9PEZI
MATQPDTSTGGEMEVVFGDVECKGRIVLYIVKANETNYINYIKPIILARELQCPHVISCIDTRDDWFYNVHPERTVPALKDQDPETEEICTVFEGTACLWYLASRFDKDGLWTGKTAVEKGRVMSWTAYQTAALGPTAKYWLYFLRGYPTRKDPVQLPRTIEKLHSNVLKQWDILENRLSELEQKYVALKDRPTIADLSYLPFAMPWMFEFFHVSINKWPHIESWSQRMLARPAVKHVLDRNTYSRYTTALLSPTATMEGILRALIQSLKEVSLSFKAPNGISLQAELHDTERLPNIKLFPLVSEAMNLLAEIRLIIEPRQMILADHFMAYMNTKALCAAIELNIPDILRDGAKTPQELAVAGNARTDRLEQVMRTLYNNGIFSFDAQSGTYQNNTTSTLLLSDHWTQWRNWVDLYGNEFYDMARGIPESCKKDATRSPAQINFDTDDSMFKYFRDHDWTPKLHKTLSGGATAQAPGILADYPWEEVAGSTIMDIGGGGGGLIASLLRQHKTMKGAILEVPSVIEQAWDNFHAPGGQYSDVAIQIPPENLVVGNFFDGIPANDVYTMKWCLHDWDDDKARIILRNIRISLRRSAVSRCIILESVLRDGYTERMSRYADLNMMVAVGGKERREDEWKRLAVETGWSLRKIYPLRNSWPSAIELVPVWSTNDILDEHSQRSSEKLVAKMHFLEPWEASRGNPYIRATPDPGYDSRNFKWQEYSVAIKDARTDKESFGLDIHGFAYFEDKISTLVVGALRGNNHDTVKLLYYPHIQQFVRRITGAARVIIFDHTVRKRRSEQNGVHRTNGEEQPAMIVRTPLVFYLSISSLASR